MKNKLLSKLKAYGFKELRFSEAPPPEIEVGKMYLFVDKNGYAEQLMVQQGLFNNNAFAIHPYFINQKDIIAFRTVEDSPIDGFGIVKFNFDDEVGDM